jgi:hypothetical protein
MSEVIVFTGADLKTDGVNGLPCGWGIKGKDGQPMKEPPHPVVGTSKPRSRCGAPRQPHREHRSLAWLARHGHIAAHHARELAADGKAQPCSAVAARGRGISLAELLAQLSLLLANSTKLLPLHRAR